jgi:hypothetical protein
MAVTRIQALVWEIWFIAVFKKVGGEVTSRHAWQSSKLKVLNELSRDLLGVQG